MGWRADPRELHRLGSEIGVSQFMAPHKLFRSPVPLLLEVTIRGRERGQEDVGNDHKRKSSDYVFRGLGRYIRRKIVE